MVSILVAAIVLFAFAASWYTFLFGRTWASLMGFDMNGGGGSGNMIKPLIGNFLLNVITAGAVYYVAPYISELSFSSFLKVIFIIWLGFAFPIYANAGLWERKSWKLVALNSAYGILAALLVSLVVYYMR